MKRQHQQALVLIVASFVILEIIVYIANYFILGRTPLTSLTTSQFANSISQQVSSSSNASFVIGKNYNISSVKYLVSNQWAVVKITSLNGSSDNGIAVFKLNGGNWQNILPFSDQYSSSSLNKLPSQVIYYLNAIGVVSYGDNP